MNQHRLLESIKLHNGSVVSGCLLLRRQRARALNRLGHTVLLGQPG